MKNLKNARIVAKAGLMNSGFAGLSSTRLGHQAFNLRKRVRFPLTLFYFLFQALAFASCNPPSMVARRLVLQPTRLFILLFQKCTWCCRLVVQDTALSARRSGVQLPSAPPWVMSSNGKTPVCGADYTGSIPVITPKFFDAFTRNSKLFSQPTRESLLLEWLCKRFRHIFLLRSVFLSHLRKVCGAN